jgi:hypothetical protein
VFLKFYGVQLGKIYYFYNNPIVSIVKYLNKCIRIKVFEYFFFYSNIILNTFHKKYSNTYSEYFFLYFLFTIKILLSELIKLFQIWDNAAIFKF